VWKTAAQDRREARRIVLFVRLTGSQEAFHTQCSNRSQQLAAMPKRFAKLL
jgi:hypothetical protein